MGLQTDLRPGVAICWFRADLRLNDQPAFAAACRYEKLLPVFVHPAAGKSEVGGASRWWLHHSLSALEEELNAQSSRLIHLRGDPLKVILELHKKLDGSTNPLAAVFWNRRYEPQSVARDREAKKRLQELGLHAESFGGSVLQEPWNGGKDDGSPYQVFSAFYRAASKRGVDLDILSVPQSVPPLPQFPQLASSGRGKGSLADEISLEEAKLLPRAPLSWADGFAKHWKPGAKAAQTQLATFVKKGLRSYSETRNNPGLEPAGTSRLSPHLHFGELSPRQVLAAVVQETGDWRQQKNESVQTFCKELFWREFAHHLLFHFPKTPEEPLRPAFQKFPWRKDARGFSAWKKGQTGYPIVDAGMRELWATGWMHNRVRMIVGSFLTKDLLLSWRDGAEWFWDTLVDADLANNTLGWQWISGCGADAAPYFRVFNPVLQGEKFDPEGVYVRRWCPELSALGKKWIHRPWEAPESEKKKVGWGERYPAPCLDHRQAKVRALQAFEKTK